MKKKIIMKRRNLVKGGDKLDVGGMHHGTNELDGMSDEDSEGDEDY